MTQEPNTDRRNVLKTLGGLGAAGIVGGGSLLALTGGASATGTFDYGSASVESDDGSVQYVAIFGDSIVKWAGFDTPATEFEINIDASAVRDSDSTEVWSGTLHNTGWVQVSEGSNWGGAGEAIITDDGLSGRIESNIGYTDGAQDASVYWDIVAPNGDPTQGSNSYSLPSQSIPASTVSSDTDGQSESYTITLTTTYTWRDANGNVLLSNSWDSAVSVGVTNIESTSTATSGDSTDGSTAG